MKEGEVYTLDGSFIKIQKKLQHCEKYNYYLYTINTWIQTADCGTKTRIYDFLNELEKEIKKTKEWLDKN